MIFADELRDVFRSELTMATGSSKTLQLTGVCPSSDSGSVDSEELCQLLSRVISVTAYRGKIVHYEASTCPPCEISKALHTLVVSSYMPESQRRELSQPELETPLFPSSVVDVLSRFVEI